MKYKIKYEYQTGGSFGSEDSDGILELGWNDLDIAKQNLKRIQEHYKYYEAKERIRGSFNTKWYKDELSLIDLIESTKPDWFVEKNQYGYEHHCIKLYADNGNVWQISCPWCGYFERLYSVEIIPNESDMKFEV